MDDSAQLALPALTGQRVEDVVRRLHAVSRFAALTGPNMALALEMERDFIFGIMRGDERPNAWRCTISYSARLTSLLAQRRTRNAQRAQPSSISGNHLSLLIYFA